MERWWLAMSYSRRGIVAVVGVQGVLPWAMNKARLAHLWLAAGSPASQHGSLKELAPTFLFLKPWALTASTRCHKSKERSHLPYYSLCVRHFLKGPTTRKFLGGLQIRKRVEKRTRRKWSVVF